MEVGEDGVLAEDGSNLHIQVESPEKDITPLPHTLAGGWGVKSCDPDRVRIPDMARYLQEGLLPGYTGWISRTHLEDLILADHPPDFYLARTEVSRKKLVTKTMISMGFPAWGRTIITAWWVDYPPPRPVPPLPSLEPQLTMS